MRKNLNKDGLSGRFKKDKIEYLDPHKLIATGEGKISDDGVILVVQKMQQLIGYINTLNSRVKALEKRIDIASKNLPI